jgi:calcium binding protein 39
MSSFITSITKRKKTPDKLVRICLQLLTEPCAEGPSGDAADPEKEVQSLCKRLSQLKGILYGTGDRAEVEEEKARELSTSVQSSGLMIILVDKLSSIPFEARKDAAAIFNNLMHKDTMAFSAYVLQHFPTVLTLIDGYRVPEIALGCGSMVRECVRHDDLARAILSSYKIWMFFDTYVHLPNFDVASDAFNTLRDLLTTTKNKTISSEFLNLQYDTVFAKYETLLLSDNYVTRRRSLKLLAELLLDRR